LPWSISSVAVLVVMEVCLPHVGAFVKHFLKFPSALLFF
jgi:hypothetical protein